MSLEHEWYMFRHECGAVFTLNAQIFNNFVQKNDFKGKIECPNCGKTALNKNEIEELTDLFYKQEALSEAGVKIERLKKEEIDDILHTILKAIDKIK